MSEKKKIKPVNGLTEVLKQLNEKIVKILVLQDNLEKIQDRFEDVVDSDFEKFFVNVETGIDMKFTKLQYIEYLKLVENMLEKENAFLEKDLVESIKKDLI